MEKSANSVWSGHRLSKKFPALESQAILHCDVLIIGGGITGLTSALQLKRRGKRVIVVEQNRIGSGDSGHTTAHLTEVIDTRYHQLEKNFGSEGARRVAQSSRAAIQKIEDWTQELSIPCEFERVPGYLYAESMSQRRELKHEFKAMKSSGLDAEWEENIPLPWTTYGGIRVQNQAQFNPKPYYDHLALAIEDGRNRIFEKTRVVDIRDGSPCEVKTENGGLIRAVQVITATGAVSSSRFFLQTKVAAYRTYALAAKFHSSKRLAKALFWDAEDPYHYIRSFSGGWIVGGEDHKTGVETDTELNFENLRRYCEDHFEVETFLSQWSGQVLESVDGLPFIGLTPSKKKIYSAVGFSGNGMTFGTVAGLVLADQITGYENEWSNLYDTKRLKPIASAKEFLVENIDFPLHLLKDRLESSKNVALSTIPAGEGRRMNIGGAAVAIYRDDGGTIHAMSAVCPHLGCNVNWNRAEKSWDCPCHGSRFDCKGSLLNGPATTSLEKVENIEKMPKKVA